MTLAQIRRQVLRNIGDPDGRTWTNVRDDLRLDRLIEDAHQELAVYAELADPTIFIQTLELTAGAGPIPPAGIGFRELGLPSDFRRLNSVFRTDISPNRAVQVIDVDRAGYYGLVSRSDVVYVRRNADVPPTTVFGIPGESSADETYAVHYAAQVPSLLPSDGTVGDGTQVPAIPEEYHYLIPLGASILALLQEHGDTSDFEEEYEDALAIMASALPTREGALVGA